MRCCVAGRLRPNMQNSETELNSKQLYKKVDGAKLQETQDTNGEMRNTQGTQ